MQLDQIYHNATNAFQNDPELRNLLLQTMEAAQGVTRPEMPPLMDVAQQRAMREAAFAAQQPGPGKGNMLSPPPGAPPPPPMAAQAAPVPSMAAQQVSAHSKSDALPSTPAAYSPMTAFGPNMMTGRMPVGGPSVPGGPAMPMPRPQPAAMPGGGGRPPMPGGPAMAASSGGPGPMRQLAAFLQGLGTSDAILPAIGGGMAAVDSLERMNAARNQTVRALMNRGLDADSAMAAAQNPEILKAVLPQLFGGAIDRAVGSDFDPVTGRERKFFYNQKGPNAGVEYIGGAKSDPGTTSITRAQGTANVKRVEKYKSEADAARDLLGNLGQLEALRKNVPDALKGLPPDMGASIARWTDYFGITDNVMSLSPKELDLQLGFTERTKGAITDREMGMFARGVPGLGMTDSAAGNVIAGMQAAANRKIEQAKFFEAWLGKNRGSLEGAQDAWDSYINANPIIVLNKDGTLTINNKNIGNWKDYVTGADEDQHTNFGPMRDDAGVVDAGAADSGGGVGSAPVPGIDGPTITTKEERDALAPGTVYYREVDGQLQQFRKGQ